MTLRVPLTNLRIVIVVKLGISVSKIKDELVIMG